MFAQLIKTFAQTNKDNFSLFEIENILKEYFHTELVSKNDDYKFLKTKWYYGYKKINTKDIYKTIILRIVKDKLQEFKNKLNIDHRQQFNHYDTVASNKDEYFDLQGLPSYINESDIYTENPSIKVIFANIDEFNDFRNKLNDIKITQKTKTVWYPNRPTIKSETGSWITDKECINKYPIYIPSYKRAENMLTVETLIDLNVKNFFVVIKPDIDEVKSYTKSMKKLNILDKLLIVNDDYIQKQAKKGNYNSIPQRNFSYKHSIKSGFTHHWCLDDNIKGFYRRHNGKKLPIINTPYPFCMVEKYCERYTNIYLASLQYSHLVPANGHRSPIIKNSKVYSCILIKNSNNIKWRGEYNEDIILTLDTLLQNKGTITFQNFLCGKMSTGSTEGGNSDIYAKDGQTKKINFLLKIYPEYVKKVVKFGHDHHLVNYDSFKDIDLQYKPTVKLNLPNLILS